MLPRTLRDNNIAIVLNLQHLAPENPTRFSIPKENAPTDNGIDRNDAPLVGRFAVPEEGTKKRRGPKSRRSSLNAPNHRQEERSIYGYFTP